MQLGIVIVTYKTNKKILSDLIKQLKKIDYQSLEVVDNTFNNRGFGKAVNLGIKKLLKKNCDWFLVLNPDIKIKKLNRRQIEETAKHFAIFGGSFSQHDQIYYGGKIDKLAFTGGLINKKPKAKYQTVDFVSGSLMFVKKEVINKIGLFKSNYFLYYEDVEYCYRAIKNKYSVGINLDIQYNHFEDSKNFFQKNHYLKQNHKLFLNEHGNVIQKIYCYLYLPMKQFIIKYL